MIFLSVVRVLPIAPSVVRVLLTGALILRMDELTLLRRRASLGLAPRVGEWSRRRSKWVLLSTMLELASCRMTYDRSESYRM